MLLVTSYYQTLVTAEWKFPATYWQTAESCNFSRDYLRLNRSLKDINVSYCSLKITQDLLKPWNLFSPRTVHSGAVLQSSLSISAFIRPSGPCRLWAPLQSCSFLASWLDWAAPWTPETPTCAACGRGEAKRTGMFTLALHGCWFSPLLSCKFPVGVWSFIFNELQDFDLEKASFTSPSSLNSHFISFLKVSDVESQMFFNFPNFKNPSCG